MRVALINVKYSPNLGDGLISECLEFGLKRVRPDWSVHAVDLAGRTAYAPGAGASRGRAIKILSRFPPRLRRFLTAMLIRLQVVLRCRPVWRRDLRGGVAILGGGQLLADSDLNFPLKIAAILRETRRCGMPLMIYGVGVSSHWSSRARQLFRAAFGAAGLTSVHVRDSASALAWQRHVEGLPLPAADVCRDPGLLCAAVYGSPARDLPRQRPVIGVGIVNPHTLGLHSELGSLSMQDAIRFWQDLAQTLVARNLDVVLFTNGPADDEAVLNEVLSGLGTLAGGEVGRGAAVKTPAALSGMIAAFDAIVAHRLHANIAAYAHRIPHVGLGWDSKVSAFFDSVGREKYMIAALAPAPEAIAALLAEALADGIDPAKHGSVMAETEAQIAALAASIDTLRMSAPPSVA